MKFLSQLDANKFLAEVQKFDKIGKVDRDYQPTNEEIKSFIKSRAPLVKKLKDNKKASAQKKNWRANRYKMMKGIKAFHKSTEGKRFHKRLGRFLSTRLFRTKRKSSNESAFNELLVKQAYLKGLNAAKQHLFVELEYFHLLEEQVDLELFITDHAIPMFRSVELNILNDEDLNEDQISFLFDILNEEQIRIAFSQRTGIQLAEIKKLWDSVHKYLKKSKIEENTDDYHTLFITRLIKVIEGKNDK